LPLLLLLPLLFLPSFPAGNLLLALCLCLSIHPPHKSCHPEQSEGPAFALAFLAVIPRRESASSLMPLSFHPSPHKSCHPEQSEGPAFAFALALAFAFLAVIPRRESASSLCLSIHPPTNLVILSKAKDPLLPLLLPLPLLFLPSFPAGNLLLALCLCLSIHPPTNLVILSKAKDPLLPLLLLFLPSFPAGNLLLPITPHPPSPQSHPANTRSSPKPAPGRHPHQRLPLSSLPLRSPYQSQSTPGSVHRNGSTETSANPVTHQQVQIDQQQPRPVQIQAPKARRHPSPGHRPGEVKSKQTQGLKARNIARQLLGLVTGHDFSRAEKANGINRASAPAGRLFGVFRGLDYLCATR